SRPHARCAGRGQGGRRIRRLFDGPPLPIHVRRLPVALNLLRGNIMKLCCSPRQILALATLILGSTLILRAATITITPASPTMLVGQTQQLTAGGAIVPTSIAAGLWHSCVLYSDQTVRCTGNNNQGE